MQNTDAIKVIVIDDDFDDFFSIKRTLMRSDRAYTITHVDDFDQASNILRREIFDVALLDFHIGKHSADELIYTVGLENLKFPIIILTGQDGYSIEKTALDLGAFDFINKLKIEPEIISRSIDFAIRRHKVEMKLRESEAQLRLAMQQAQEASRAKEENTAKSNFLTQMSHELRTPLNAIIGFSEVIQNDHLNIGINNQYREYSSLIKKSGHHLLSLVNDLLDIGKIESGNTNLEPVDLSARVLIDDAIALNQRSAEKRGITICSNVAMNHIYGDKRALMQVLVNLMSNAIKFSHESGKIEIFCYPEGNQTIFEVIDYGIGIREEEIQKAMSPFEQTESSYYCEANSTGLGLSISKSLINLHNGDIQINSVFGKKTSVKINIPAPKAYNKSNFA